MRPATPRSIPRHACRRVVVPSGRSDPAAALQGAVEDLDPLARPVSFGAFNGIVEGVNRHGGEQRPRDRLGVVGLLSAQMNRPQVHRRQATASGGLQRQRGET